MSKLTDARIQELIHGTGESASKTEVAELAQAMFKTRMGVLNQLHERGHIDVRHGIVRAGASAKGNDVRHGGIPGVMRDVHGLPVPKTTPPMPPVKAPRADGPTEAELAAAQRVVDNEDYLPWADVKAAKALLGIVDPDYVAEARALLDPKAAKPMPPAQAPAAETPKDELTQVIRAAWDVYRGDKELPLDDAFTFACGFKAGQAALVSNDGAQAPVGYADPMAFTNFRSEASTKEWMWAKPDAGLVAIYTRPYTEPYELTRERVYDMAAQAGYDRNTPVVRLAFAGFDILMFARLLSGQAG